MKILFAIIILDLLLISVVSIRLKIRTFLKQFGYLTSVYVGLVGSCISRCIRDRENYVNINNDIHMEK